jgi:hypothetical protein
MDSQSAAGKAGKGAGPVLVAEGLFGGLRQALTSRRERGLPVLRVLTPLPPGEEGPIAQQWEVRAYRFRRSWLGVCFVFQM